MAGARGNFLDGPKDPPVEKPGDTRPRVLTRIRRPRVSTSLQSRKTAALKK